MVTLIKAMNNTLVNVNIDTLIGLCFCGIAVEMLFVWMPFLNLDKWCLISNIFSKLFFKLNG